MDKILTTNAGYTIAVIVTIALGALIGAIWARKRGAPEKRRLSIGVTIFVAASFIADAIYFLVRG